MPRTALSTFSVLVLIVALCGSEARGDESVIQETTLEDGFMEEVLAHGLKSAIPVLEDNGVTSLRIFSSLEKEDFTDMSLKLGHRREMLRWWKSFTNSDKGMESKVKTVKDTRSRKKTTSDPVKTRSVDSYPSPTATHSDWGAGEYTHCKQPYLWNELIHGYKNMNRSTFFKMGGLGKLLEEDGHETWQCLRDHYCAVDPYDPWFCFVYHETDKTFTPWGENAKLQLVKTEGKDGTVCMCDKGYIGADGVTCVQCEAGKYKNITGSSQCVPCAANSSSPAGSREINDCECNAGYIGPRGGPCTSSDYNCAIQDCVEHQSCFVELSESHEGLRNIATDPQLRSSTPSEDTLNLLLDATYYRSDEMWNSRPVWNSTVAGGTKLCWYPGVNPWRTGVWNIMSGGQDCDSYWAHRNGYVSAWLVNGDFHIAYPTAVNKKFGILRCGKMTE